MYRIENFKEYSIYHVDKSNLKIKAIDNGLSKKVYIKYAEYNPLFAMLLGDFSDECKTDGISFNTENEINGQPNTEYVIVANEDLEIFIKNVYFFIVENNVERMLNEKDIAMWNF